MATNDEATGGSGLGGEAGNRTIHLENVTKTFNNGEVVAIEDVNLDINPDEFVVLLGPSGCGKTTTLRCIAGLEIPNSGSIRIGSREITTAEPKDRDLAFVFQTITLFPHMTVRENIRFGLDMKTELSMEEKEARVQEAAEMLGIPELLDRQPSELSGGQQQRVSLGRAMVMEPVAFLLDEPFSALDANLRDQMRTEAKRLHRRLEDTGMVFVTHDQEEAMTLGDKIVVMNDAEILQVGSPYDIYNDPNSDFVAQFIGSPSTNMITCTVEEEDGDLLLAGSAFTLRLTEQQQRDLGEDVVGSTVTAGVRPEYIDLEGDGLFEAEIVLIEPQGSDDNIYLESGDLEIRATVDQGEITEHGTVGVDIDPEDVWLFDRTGERLV